MYIDKMSTDYKQPNLKLKMNTDIENEKLPLTKYTKGAYKTHLDNMPIKTLGRKPLI